MAEPMWIVTHVAPYADGPAGVHGVLPQAERGLVEIAEDAGLVAVLVPDVRDLAPVELRRGGVLALFTIGETPFSDDQKEAIVETWRAGDLGVLGVHSATDACRAWPEYGAILGARFDGHPWTQAFTIDVVDQSHPATAHLGTTWDWHDEVYLFAEVRPEARVLLHVAEGQLDPSAPGARRPAAGFPLAWCLDDGGRTFYSALGHFPGAWETPAYLRHLAGGLAWVLGDDDR